MSETSKDYQQGYRDAMARAQENVAMTLRLYAVTSTATEEAISDSLVRDIFTSSFGVKACDDEFGPEPTGAGVREKIQKYLAN